ncbi:hypothetical protein GCM10010170_056040 [Dactylosporangium salmoneum]|uniref:Uncharacterized protein n=1 Tax=Dactylosporangium salmoneum TaxID=53361 RepID=A0ABN3GTV8_9ACTN
MAGGAAAARAEPTVWSAEVTRCDRRRADMSVLRLRTYLQYPCAAGMRAVVGVPRLAGRTRDCWVGNLPEADRTVELHVALHGATRSGRSWSSAPRSGIGYAFTRRSGRPRRSTVTVRSCSWRSATP